MAETFSQRAKSVNAGLRRLRVQYRKTDSQGEVLERELDRLILRKTIVSPESLTRLSSLYAQYEQAVNSMQGPLSDAIRLATSYV